MSYIYYLTQNHEFLDPHYNYPSAFPTMWTDPRFNQNIPQMPIQPLPIQSQSTQPLPTQSLPIQPLSIQPLPIQQLQGPTDILMDQDLSFSLDGSSVITESQSIPMVYYIFRLRDSHKYHYMNPNTATCWLWVKGCTEPNFPAHRIYLATQSLYFRTIFEENNLNITQSLEINLPHPEVFPGIYKFLYDGDADAWLEDWFKDREQIRKSWELVKFLELVQVPDKVSLRARMELEAIRLT